MIKFIKKLFKIKKNNIPEIIIKEFNFKDNTTEITMQHPLFYKFVEAHVKLFKEKGGINYVSTDMYHPEMGMFEVIIQKSNGKTPAQLNSELKEKIKELESQLNKC